MNTFMNCARKLKLASLSDKHLSDYKRYKNSTIKKDIVMLKVVLRWAYIVMKWTGHNDYKAMKPYIDVADETKAEAMKKFDDF